MNLISIQHSYAKFSKSDKSETKRERAHCACSLHGKDKHEWESALNKLGRVPNLQIRDILKISYDGLEDEEIKNVFLDIACFFTGQDIDDVARLLNGCYHAVFHGISVLKDKALINIKLNKIEMSDPLQELGWDIVIQECKSEPGRRTRLWRSEDVHHVLKRNTGTETVGGILGDLPLSVPPLSRARSLTNLKLKNLHIEQLPEDIGCLTSLRKLDLRGNDFKSLPASIKHLSELEELYISYCTSLESLLELPSGLVTINAHSCASLGTMLGDMEFLAAAFNGRYIFSNCFRFLEDVNIKILAAAKLLFQPLTQSAWSRRKVMVCLSSSNAPDWFTDWVKCPSMTVQLPTKVCKQTFAGVALCICVAFLNDCPESYFRIICEYRFESEEGDYHKGCTCLYKWVGLRLKKAGKNQKFDEGVSGQKITYFSAMMDLSSVIRLELTLAVSTRQ